MVEALTQSPPALDEKSAAVLPAILPPAFLSTVRRCLSSSPADRPTIFDLEAQFSRAPQTPVPPPAATRAPVPPPATTRVPVQATAPQNSPQPRPHSSKVRFLGPAIAVSIIVLVAIWASIRPFRPHSNPKPPALTADQTSSPPPAAQPSASRNPADSMPAATAVLHQEMPVLSHGTRNSIHGKVRVTVLVTVDRAGNVVGEAVENRGSSAYFARLAADAAKKWQFSPAATQEPRQWLLEFGFTRAGITGQAVPRSTGGPSSTARH
jgi:outer membrane biosynthesis protein TonB